MHELHRQRVLEEVPPQRRFMREPRRIRNEAAVDQRPRVVDQSRAQTGDQRAEIDLQQHQPEQCNGGRANARRRLDGGALAHPPCGPEDRGEDHAGQDQMDREPVLRDLDAVGEPGRHHPPADAALQRAEPEDRPQPPAQARLDPALHQEPQERQQERGADQPAHQPVRPFPPEDGLELVAASCRC